MMGILSLFLVCVLAACTGDNEEKSSDDTTNQEKTTQNGNTETNHSEMDHSNMDHSSSGEVSEGLKEAENPTYPVGSQPVMHALIT